MYAADSTGQCTWVLTLPAMKADAKKTYTITVSSDKYGSDSISDVMFGDVWVCSGQSNMQFTVPQVSHCDLVGCMCEFSFIGVQC